MSEGEFDRLSTGVPGIDEVLGGGLIPRRGYMIRGAPGSGKTILGLHYLTEGTANGESALFVNLEEDEEDVRRNAASLGFDLEGIEFLDLSPGSDTFVEGGGYTVFDPGEVEGEAISGAIADRVDEVEPDRVFVDPMTRLRHLAPDQYQFRKQATGFVRYLTEAGATVVFTSQASASEPDDDLQFLSHGVIDLDRSDGGRTLGVPKFRGSGVESGPHGMRIDDDGIRVFPTLVPGEFSRSFDPEAVSSGVPAIDELLHGGLERGTVTVLSGPTGVGKTTLGSQFMKEAAGRGERSVMYLFEESPGTFLERAKSVNIPVERMRERGTLSVEPVEPLVRSTDEFAETVRNEVEAREADIVMIDGIEGYRLGVRGDGDVITELHSLCRYLKNMGVTTILVDEADTVTGEFRATGGGVSYLADNIVFLRYIEVDGELRKAIGVLKKRTSDFGRSLRVFEITEHGIKVGEPLTGLRGILRGDPEIVGDDHDAADGK